MRKTSTFGMTIVNLTKDLDLGNPVEDQIKKDELAFRYYRLQRLRKEAVTKNREADSALAASKIAAAEFEKANVDFLTEAGKINPLVEVEQMWTLPYQMENGDVMLESPQTERDTRMALRLGHKSMVNAMEQSGIDPNDMSDMFGTDPS